MNSLFGFKAQLNYLSSAIVIPLCFRATWAAARRAIGTLNGEQET